MSHYEDAWDELHASEFNRINKARNIRERLINELTTDELIKIMFADFIDKVPDRKVIEMGVVHLKK